MERMSKGLKNLTLMEYPGRIIIIGQDRTARNDVVIYAITGRSPSSQARKLVKESHAIWARPTNEETTKKGNLDLLVYPAIMISGGIAVGNGRQTPDIEAQISYSKDPVEILSKAIQNWDYEPDPPMFTPRICGCILSRNGAAMGIIRRGPKGQSIRTTHEIPLMAGMGRMITTYIGENKDPLVSFSKEPIEVDILEDRAEDMAKAIYKALEPKHGKADFRVAVGCVFSRSLDFKDYEMHIINRFEKMRS